MRREDLVSDELRVQAYLDGELPPEDRVASGLLRAGAAALSTATERHLGDPLIGM